MGQPTVHELALAAFEAAPEAVVLVDRGAHLLLANRRAEAVFGYAEGEMGGLALAELVPPRLRKHHAVYHDRYFDSPRARPMGTGLEIVAIRRDGSEFPAQVALSPIVVAGADESLVAASIRDISVELEARLEAQERIEAREAVAEAQIAEATQQVSRARYDSDEYHRALAHYMTLVRHRVANPLQVILGMARTLRELPDIAPGERDTMLAAIEDAAMRLGNHALFHPEQQGPEESTLDPSPRDSPS